MAHFMLWTYRTGEKIWSASGFGQMEATGAIAGDVIVAGGFSKLVQAFNRYNGQVLWSFNSSYGVQASPLIVDRPSLSSRPIM